jgi:hypothetical protein
MFNTHDIESLWSISNLFRSGAASFFNSLIVYVIVALDGMSGFLEKKINL